MKPRLFLVEDQPAMLEILRAALPALLECEIIGVASTGAEALKRIPQSKCDVAWIAMDLAPMDGPALLGMLRGRRCEVVSVLFARTDYAARIRDSINAQPDGFVHYADEISCWRESLRSALRGGHYFSPRIAVAKRQPATDSLASLSNTERTVLGCIVRGVALEQIADQLGISPHTARHHRENLMKKLAAHSTAELCTIACRTGLIDCAPPP